MQSLGENKNSERREFNRYPIEFVIQVSAKDISGKIYNEKTVLLDISAGGARFITERSDKYFVDQQLDINIDLPGADDMAAQMKGKATVARIDSPYRSEINGKRKGISIAVKIDLPLYFERFNL